VVFVGLGSPAWASRPAWMWHAEVFKSPWYMPVVSNAIGKAFY